MTFAQPIKAASLLAALLLAAAVGYGVAVRTHRATSNTSETGGATAPAATAPAKTDRKVLYWYDPMYPQQKFDQPGKSPFMDMPLVAKYADEDSGGGVRIDPALSQSLGMRVAAVERRALATEVNAVAAVVFNDRDVAVVQARAGGFVERVYSRALGDVITAGAPLADVLVTEWAGAQAEFLAVRSTGDAELTAAARQRLLLLGMSEAQIAQVERSGKPSSVMTLASPIAGVIQELGVRAGMSVSPGMTLARINGLRTVWLEAAVPEAQAGMLDVGRKVEATFTAYAAQRFEGKISAILPEANVQTRTLRVRMEFPNPQLRLKPGMFAQVRIAGQREEALVVPSDAVIRTGKRAIVYVSEQPGRFHPVEVEVGREMDGKLVVLRGLEQGQQVAVSGQFLIDSEASMRGVTERMAAGGGESAISKPQAQAHEGIGTITQLSQREVTISHGPIPSMQWGPMNMPFQLRGLDAAKDLKPGDAVRFRFQQAGDEFVIESIEKTKDAR